MKIWIKFPEVVVSLAVLLVLACPAAAEPKYWDTDGSSVNGLQPGDGPRDTTAELWSTSTAGDSPVVTWADGDDARIQAPGTSRLTIPAGTTLSANVWYIGANAAGAVQDLSGNYFSGIPDTVTWRFTTEDAVLLVYEGFDISGVAGGTLLNGLAGGETSQGLTGTWTAATGAKANITYESDGLTFGSGATTLVTTGGRMLQWHDFSIDANINATRKLDVTVSGGQTLYGSYLFKIEDNIYNLTRASFDVEAGSIIRSSPFVWNSTLGRISSTSGDSNNTGTAPGNPGDTVMALFSVSNVGGSSGAVTMKQWFLTSDQFDYWKALDMPESSMSAAATGTQSDGVLQKASVTIARPTTWATFNSTHNLRAVCYRGEGPYGGVLPNDGMYFAYDEFRFGNSLDAVTPVATDLLPTGMLLIVR